MNKTFRFVAVATVALLSLLNSTAYAQQDVDWPNYSFYAEQNKLVKEKPKAVLFGDSITQFWVNYDAQWLVDHNFVGRGISGQTTMHMLPRFRQDVIELAPEYVAILAGINDIARNHGYIEVENTFKNLVSMVELAQLHGIKPVMCTVCPADIFPWRKELGNPTPSIERLNTLIRNYAAEHSIPLADYYTPMCAEDGAMIKDYQNDAVHPNLNGYKVMEKVLLETLGL